MNQGAGATIIATGWRQGALLPRELASRLLASAPGHIEERSGPHLLLVSHDCDLARPPTAEPTVEVIVAREIEDLSGEYTHSHNSRTLHVKCESGSRALPLEMRAHQKFSIPKESLTGAKPGGHLSPCDLNTLTRWLSNRYRRPALPDEFNRRLRAGGGRHLRKAKKAVKRKAFRDRVLGVYMRLDPDGEVSSAEEVYRVDLVAIVGPDAMTGIQRLSDINAAFDAFVAALQQVEGVEILNWEVVPDDEFTFRDAQHSQRFDFDYLSLEVDESPPLD